MLAFVLGVAGFLSSSRDGIVGQFLAQPGKDPKPPRWVTMFVEIVMERYTSSSRFRGGARYDCMLPDGD